MSVRSLTTAVSCSSVSSRRSGTPSPSRIRWYQIGGSLAENPPTGTGMPLSAGVLDSLSAAVAQGWGDKDIGELARFFREHMGQKLD